MTWKSADKLKLEENDLSARFCTKSKHPASWRLGLLFSKGRQHLLRLIPCAKEGLAKFADWRKLAFSGSESDFQTKERRYTFMQFKINLPLSFEGNNRSNWKMQPFNAFYRIFMEDEMKKQKQLFSWEVTTS